MKLQIFKLQALDVFWQEAERSGSYDAKGLPASATSHTKPALVKVRLKLVTRKFATTGLFGHCIPRRIQNKVLVAMAGVASKSIVWSFAEVSALPAPITRTKSAWGSWRTV